MRELVQVAYRDYLDIRDRFEDVMAYMRDHSEEYCLRRQRIAGHLPALYAEKVDRLSYRAAPGFVYVAVSRQEYFGKKGEEF